MAARLMAEASTPGVRPPRLARWELAGLAGVLLGAGILRVIALDSSLWYDEVLTLTDFVRLPWRTLVATFSSFNNHLFYTLQAKTSIALLGESAWALRLPAVLFGIGSIAVTWSLARRAADPAAAMLTAFLLAISYHHVWFSQNARGYTGMLFWTALGTLLLTIGLQQPRRSVWLGYAACIAAAAYTHLSTAFFFAAQVIAYGLVALRCRTRPGHPWSRTYPGVASPGPLAAFVIGGLASAILYAGLLREIVGTARKVTVGAGTVPLAEWESPWRAAQEIVNSSQALGRLTLPAVLVGAALLVHGARLLWRRHPLLVLSYALQVPITVALLTAGAFRIWPRYFFVDIGFVFMCIAVSACAIGAWCSERLQRHGVTPALAHRGTAWAMVVVMAAGSAVLLARNYAYPKQDFRGAVALVQRERGPGDMATSIGRGAEPIRHYFAPEWPVITTAGELRQLLDHAQRVWLVMAFAAPTERNFPDVMQTLRERFDLVAALPGTLGDGTMRVYRSRQR